MGDKYSITCDYFGKAANAACRRLKNAAAVALQTKNVMHETAGWLVARAGETLRGLVKVNDLFYGFTSKNDGKLRNGEVPVHYCMKGQIDTLQEPAKAPSHWPTCHGAQERRTSILVVPTCERGKDNPRKSISNSGPRSVA